MDQAKLKSDPMDASSRQNVKRLSNVDKIRFDSTTSVADFEMLDSKNKAKKRKRAKRVLDFAEDEKEEEFRRFVMFVFKNRDESKSMAPLYIVFYSKPEYVAFKK